MFLCFKRIETKTFSMVKMETHHDLHLDQPPAEDSPKHILNALNNHCLQECFRRLSTHADFFNVANVCKRFRAIARACFPPTNITLAARQSNGKLLLRKADQDQKYWQNDSSLPLIDLESFLSIFGGFIKSVDFDSTLFNRQFSLFGQNFAKIVQYCGKSLEKLSFYNYGSSIDIQKSFESLKFLKIHDSIIWNIEPIPCLKVLDIRGPKYRYSIFNHVGRILKQHYPQLEVIILDEISRVDDEMMTNFLVLNPQLRTLHVSYCDSITTSILNGIDTRAPNLEHLTLVLLTDATVNEDWMQIGKIQNLKSLRTNLDRILPTKPLIDLLIENDLPIEKLCVVSAYKNIEDDLAKFKNFKIFSAVQCDNDILMDFGPIRIKTHTWTRELCNLH